MADAYILVKAVDGWNPDDPMVYLTGYPIDVRSHSRIGGKQIPPNYIQIHITDAEPSEVEVYCKKWIRDIDYEFTDHDYPNDAHTIRAFTKPELVSTSGMNSLTRDKVEAFLNKWNATVDSIGPNEVIFNATVFGAIASDGFWGIDTSLVGFTEKSYDEATGIHAIEINYAALSGITAEKVAAIVVNHGGTVIKNIPDKITFTIHRDTVFNFFKLDVQRSVYGDFARRMFYFTQQAVDLALANNDPGSPDYATLTVTRQQALAYVHDRLLD